MSAIKYKLKELLTQLNHGLVDREEEMKIALLSLVAGENMLLVGPPGTAKSLIARRLTQCITQDSQQDGTHFFEYLLTKFSTPEEIFGPLSIAKLKTDCFERNTAGYLPSVRVAFLDEIFKASSSILNALLTILNERIYHNGSAAQAVPLRSLIAASNELPTGQEELSALYDRFLLRSFVDYVKSDQLHRLFALNEADDEINSEQAKVIPLRPDELRELDGMVERVTISKEIEEVVLEVWQQHRELFKEDRRERLSDRRLVKIIRLLRVSAASNGRREVDFSDVMLLCHCLWNDPENVNKIFDLIVKTLRKCSHIKLGSAHNITLVAEGKNPFAFKSPAVGIIKGLCGSGTEFDPLQIGNIDQLLQLGKPEVGQQGYYFRQTTDIDVSILSSWSSFDFSGHYDGAGFTIIGAKKTKALFKVIQSGSEIQSLWLRGFSLANQAIDSEIRGCTVEQTLILDSAKECNISTCNVLGSLIQNKAEKCNITRCLVSGQSIGKDYPKLGEVAKNCIVSDCLFLLDGCDLSWSRTIGLVAGNFDDSKIERCFITGKSKINGSNVSLSLFKGSNSSTEACVYGAAYLKALYGGELQPYFDHRYDYEIEINDPKLKLINNAVLDGKKLFSGDRYSANGKHGRNVAAATINQYFFENTLNWDFDTIWVWDSQTGHPTLQSVGVGGPERSAGPDDSDLLVQQISANIWL